MIAAFALLAALQAPADSTAGPPPRNHVFFETGMAVPARSPFGAAGLAVGIHVTSVPPNGVGMDFAISSYVDPLTHGSVNILTDLDAAYVSWRPHQPSVVLRAGLSALTAHGMGLGLNVGAGVMIPVGKTVSLRVDYTYRPLLGDLTGLALSGLSVGVGVDY
ncbi:MAG TPA: hypothetical protein VJN62_00315 [Gemmatimonadales bacterium]|nr:hypothetical protein [Gemmatimonadales bacterium]